jgi:hypothetical protein
MRILNEYVPRWATGGSYEGRQYLATVQDRRLRERGSKFLKYLSVILLLLAILGKPFAYTFIPDIFLVVGLFVLSQSPGRRMLVCQPILIPLALFILWGAYRTYPYLGRYKIDAVRDAVIWGYGVWVFVIMGLLCVSPERLVWMVRKYSSFTWIFLLVMPPLYLAYRITAPVLPIIPIGGGTPILFFKAGDVLMHLGGVIAFLMLFNNNSRLWLKILLIGVIVGMAGMHRGGMVAMCATIFVAFIARPGSKVVWSLIATTVFAIGALWITGVELQFPGTNRGISFDQLQTAVESSLGHNTGSDMEATREWRLNWWKDIINYTIHGRYFWTGKGFGINLAQDDGYEVLQGGELRSPHNGHMVILARSGVPGLCLWIMTQGIWIGAMVAAYLRARKVNDRRWCAVFAFLLAYWTGFMVNASFDVFLEGPMGGVWFWSLYGIGLSASWIFTHSPETMYPEGRAPEKTQSPTPSRLPRPSWNRLATPAVG